MSHSTKTETRSCPNCSKEILSTALKCKYCKLLLPELDQPIIIPAEETNNLNREKSKIYYQNRSTNSFLVVLSVIVGIGALISGREPYFVALMSMALFFWTENRFHRDPVTSNYLKLRYFFWIAILFYSLALIAIAIQSLKTGKVTRSLIVAFFLILNIVIGTNKTKKMFEKTLT